MGIRERIIRKKVEGKIERELGDKSLAYLSRIIRGAVRVGGKDKIRKQVISGIESDMKRAIRTGSIDKLVNDALGTPDYMDMLADLDMDESHLRFLADEAKTKWGDNEARVQS